MAKILIPPAYRQHADNQSAVQIPATTVGTVLEQLCDRFPGLVAVMLNEGGELHSFLNVYVDRVHVHDLQGMDTAVTDASEVWLIPAMAGGSESLVSDGREGTSGA